MLIFFGIDCMNLRIDWINTLFSIFVLFDFSNFICCHLRRWNEEAHRLYKMLHESINVRHKIAKFGSYSGWMYGKYLC